MGRTLIRLLRRRLLFLVPFAPDREGHHGGARATGVLIDRLATCHEVTVAYADRGEEAQLALPRACEQIHAVPLRHGSGGMRSAFGKIVEAARLLLGANPAWTRELAGPEVIDEISELLRAVRPDVVHLEFGAMAFLADAVRRAAPGAQIVITEHEPGWIAGRSAGKAGWKRRLNLALEARAWRRYARRWLPLADALVCFTPEDREEVVRLLGAQTPPVHIIPLRITPDDHGNLVPIASDLLFVGNYRHPPNEDAARRLAHGILPLITGARPGTRLALVGVDPPTDLHPTEHLIVTGKVTSTRPYLDGTTVVIVPLRQGGGMRVKVLEALAAGKPVIASSLAVAGLPLEPGLHYAPAESDSDFAAAAVALLSDPARCRLLGQAGRAWSERHNDETAVIADYEQLYTLLEARSRQR